MDITQNNAGRWILEVSDKELEAILESLHNSASEDLEAAIRGDVDERDEWESSAARKERLAKRIEER